MLQSYCANLSYRFGYDGQLLAYYWIIIDLILMVCDVNFFIPTVHEGRPNRFEMFKTVLAWLQNLMTCSAIVAQIGFDQDISCAFIICILGLPWLSVETWFIEEIMMVVGICYGFQWSSLIQLWLYHKASGTVPDVDMNNYSSIKNVLRW